MKRATFDTFRFPKTCPPVGDDASCPFHVSKATKAANEQSTYNRSQTFTLLCNYFFKRVKCLNNCGRFIIEVDLYVKKYGRFAYTE